MRICLLLCLLAALAGCNKNPGAPPPAGIGAKSNSVSNAALPQLHLNHAQPRLRTMKIWVGTQELEAELAVTVTEVATGMMFRTNMTDSEGMLFLFASGDRRGFYMKNCVLPLSAAYIDAAGVVDQIIDLHPGVETSVPSRSDQIKYVLEVPQGWFTRHQVPTGALVTTARGPLKGLSGMLH